MIKMAFYERRYCYLLGLKMYKSRSRILWSVGLLILFSTFWLFLPVFHVKSGGGYLPGHLRSGSSADRHGYYMAFNLTDLELVRIPTIAELRMKWIQKKLDRLSKKMEKLMVKKMVDVKEAETPNEGVHVFYFAWFRNLEEDGFWNRWQTQPPSGPNSSTPPQVIDSGFYPKLGCYSSTNISVIDLHMRMIRKAGIGVVILSWVPPPSPDSPKSILTSLLDIANKYGLKVALQIEYYETRSIKEVFLQIKFFISKYGNHSAIYRIERNSKLLPVYYIHETFQIGHTSWKLLLTDLSNTTIRGSQYDGVFLAHLSEQHQSTLLKAANFDGFYTYSSANGLSYGSSWKNWQNLAKFAQEKKLIFIPCIGPGYKYDKRTKETRHRLHGDYYEVGWRSALTVRPKIIGVNSFNNWQDGNQIEPATAWRNNEKTYFGYEPEGHLFYLNLTLWWVNKFFEQTHGL